MRTITISALPPQHLRTVELKAPQALLVVQVAITEAQQARGLMGVRSLRPRTGMIFLFRHDSPQTFWMKDTLIPLDMVFISSGGTIRSIFAHVPPVTPAAPDDRIPFEAGSAKYVLEIPSGEAAIDGLKVGTKITGLPKP